MKKKIMIFGGLCLLVLGLYSTGLLDALSLAALRESFQEHPLLSAGVYFVGYILVTGLSLPGAAIMTLVGGAVFGFGWGLLLVSFASSLGATLAMLVSRFLLRDWVEARFGSFLNTVNAGIKRDGAFYLFTLRLIPVIPFFVINLVFGLTRISPWRFYWVSQLGMLAGTIVYVNAGAQLGAVEELSLSGIMTPGLLSAFVLLAIFPWIAREGLDRIKARKVFAGFENPKSFDYNLVAIGAGSGGLVSAYIGAAVKAKVALIEKAHMGGDCLNTGCVPSKALLKCARLAEQARDLERFGITAGEPQVNFPQVMARVQQSVDEVAPHDSVERYTQLGVECLEGEAKLLSPWEVQVGEQVITAKNIVLATGASPVVPDIPGIQDVPHITSDTLWNLKELPQRLLVIGGGPIGCEMAQAFQRLGSEVTMVVRSELLPKEDRDIAAALEQRLCAEGINVLNHCEVEMFMSLGEHMARVVSSKGQGMRDIYFDTVLVAMGRRANTSNLGLEELGIELNPNGTIKVDEYLRTKYPNIFACGDVAGPYQLTHAASHQAWYASVNALFGAVKKFKADYRVIPWVTYTEPEVARVGVSETEAKQQGLAFEVTTYELDELDRAIAEGQREGKVKVLTAAGSDKILGAAITGAHAGELLPEFVLAMKHNIGLNKILGTIHSYPTWAEANKYAAGEWKKAHAPEKLLDFASQWHAWQRGELKTHPAKAFPKLVFQQLSQGLQAVLKRN
ncbi:MAG: FAD-dependent oxidoreductase [Cellvibrionaceae bacterium]